MKFKFINKASVETDNFWSDLFEGGYLHFEKVVDDPEQVKQLKAAKKLIIEFKDQAERAGIIQYF